MKTALPVPQEDVSNWSRVSNSGGRYPRTEKPCFRLWPSTKNSLGRTGETAKNGVAVGRTAHRRPHVETVDQPGLSKLRIFRGESERSPNMENESLQSRKAAQDRHIRHLARASDPTHTGSKQRRGSVPCVGNGQPRLSSLLHPTKHLPFRDVLRIRSLPQNERASTQGANPASQRIYYLCASPRYLQ
ncbi:hypothetical protein VTK26DRAFT_3250 [Humicola hyalothermophila]